MSALVMWLTLAGAGLLLIVLRLRGRLRPEPFVALALLLVCVDLFRMGMGFNPGDRPGRRRGPPTPAVRYPRGPAAGRFVATEEVAQNVLSFEFGLFDARGYDLPIIERYDRLWRREITPVDRNSDLRALLNVQLPVRELTPRALRSLRLLGVTHVLRARVRPDAPPFEPLVPCPPLGASGCAWSTTDPTRACTASRALATGLGRRLPAGGGGRRGAARRRHPPRLRRASRRGHRAPLEGLPGERLAPPPAGDARLERYEDERVTIRAQAARRRCCSSSTTRTSRGGRRRSTGVTSRSSAWTTRSGACGSPPAPRRSSCATSR